MTTSLRLVGGSPEPNVPITNTPLVRAEHDQRFVVRHADRELERLTQQRPDLREKLTALRDEFSKNVSERGAQFRQSGGSDYLSFAQNLARMRRDLSTSLRDLVQQNPAPGISPMDPVTPPLSPRGRLDVRG